MAANNPFAMLQVELHDCDDALIESARALVDNWRVERDGRPALEIGDESWGECHHNGHDFDLNICATEDGYTVYVWNVENKRTLTAGYQPRIIYQEPYGAATP